jgi:uncharacterized repeat protein (TIGR02543 family)
MITKELSIATFTYDVLGDIIRINLNNLGRLNHLLGSAALSSKANDFFLLKLIRFLKRTRKDMFMKRVMVFVFSLSLLLVGCNGTSSSVNLSTTNTAKENESTAITMVIDEDDKVIYFETNGGSEVSPLVNPEWEDVLNLPISVKDGYILDGWYEDEDLKTEFDIGWIGDLETITLYAKWAVIDDNVIIVSLELNLGFAPYDYIPMDVNNPFSVTLVPEKSGYTFRGWFLDENLKEHYDEYHDFTEDITLYAGWVEGNYKLIYSEEDFLSIADDLSGNYLLMTWLTFPSDIDEYTVIGDEEHPFSGILDGNHWGIRFMYLLMNQSSDNIGLFGVITGTVRNLELTIWNEFDPYSLNESFNYGGLAGKLKGHVENSKFHVEQSFNLINIDGEINIGMIAGVVDGGSMNNIVISRGAFSEVVIDNSGMSLGDQVINIGMICGKSSNASFENIAVNGNIGIIDDYTTLSSINIDYALGGAIGRALNTSLTWVFNEEAWYDISPSIFNEASDGIYYVGGLIADARNCDLDYVYSWQDIDFDSDVHGNVYLGGLLGYAFEGSLENAYMEGFVGMGGSEFVMSNSMAYIGGVIGYANQSSINSVARGGDTKIHDLGEGRAYLAGLIAVVENSSVSNAYMYASMISVYSLVDTDLITIAYLLTVSNNSALSNLWYVAGISLILNFMSVADTGYGNSMDFDTYEQFIDNFLLQFDNNDWYNNIYDKDLF